MIQPTQTTLTLDVSPNGKVSDEKNYAHLPINTYIMIIMVLWGSSACIIPIEHLHKVALVKTCCLMLHTGRCFLQIVMFLKRTKICPSKNASSRE